MEQLETAEDRKAPDEDSYSAEEPVEPGPWMLTRGHGRHGLELTGCFRSRVTAILGMENGYYVAH